MDRPKSDSGKLFINAFTLSHSSFGMRHDASSWSYNTSSMDLRMISAISSRICAVLSCLRSVRKWLTKFSLSVMLKYALKPILSTPNCVATFMGVKLLYSSMLFFLAPTSIGNALSRRITIEKVAPFLAFSRIAFCCAICGSTSTAASALLFTLLLENRPAMKPHALLFLSPLFSTGVLAVFTKSYVPPLILATVAPLARMKAVVPSWMITPFILL